MKCKVAKRDLEVALKVVSHTKDDGASNISSHYLFRRTDPNTLELLSYNGRVYSSCPTRAAFEGEPLSFTIEAKRVDLLMDAIPEDAVIEFTYEGKGEVIANTARGNLSFSSLDPSQFPYWDEPLAKAKRTTSISAERLSQALAHAGMWVYDDEQKQANLCIVEFVEGNLFSTDKLAVSVVKVPGMEKSEMRVFGADVKHLTTFLSTFKAKSPVPEAEPAKDGEKKGKAPDPEVEIFEGAKALFLKRADGAVFGESRFDKKFPEVSIEWESEDDHVVDVKKSEVASAIKFLIAGAKFDDTTIYVDLQSNFMRLSMKSSANAKMASLEIPYEAHTHRDGELPEMPKGGFPFSNAYLGRLLSTYSGDVISFRISKRPKGGWIRVKDDRQGDIFYTTVAWLKSA
jgi:DNA polymerase III sliding clamp (beta) subunit (PCNA family)